MMTNQRTHQENTDFGIAYFVTPHGYGHAARASAVIEELHSRLPNMHLTIYTTVPTWFFSESLTMQFTSCAVKTDIGFVQKNPFEEDLEMTIVQLNKFFPPPKTFIDNLAYDLEQRNIKLIICDISVLGIIVGKQLGVPSLLIENFTWDWIYQAYQSLEKRFSTFIQQFDEYYASADYHIQAKPVGRTVPADLTSPPISRKIKTPAHVTREILGIDTKKNIVLITMGGVPCKHKFLEHLNNFPSVHFIIAGSGERNIRSSNVTHLVNSSGFFHPDLVHASNVVIGKLGYSTVAEVFNEGVPFGYIPRKSFPETPSMRAFVEDYLPSNAFTLAEFTSGEWLRKLPELLEKKRKPPSSQNGADLVADYVINVIINHIE